MAKLIKTWDELIGLENDKYKVVVDLDAGNGWIISKNNEDDWKEYLSTHTFYGSQYQVSTKTFQKYGFDIEIDNWDKEVSHDKK